MVTAAQVTQHVDQSAISKIKLTEEDILMILNTLVYDGKIERVAGLQEGYRAIADPSESALIARATGMVEIPCTVCPVREMCTRDKGAGEAAGLTPREGPRVEPSAVRRLRRYSTFARQTGPSTRPTACTTRPG